jgi:hypothetical protein
MVSGINSIQTVCFVIISNVVLMRLFLVIHFNGVFQTIFCTALWFPSENFDDETFLTRLCKQLLHIAGCRSFRTQLCVLFGQSQASRMLIRHREGGMLLNAELDAPLRQ